MHVQGPTSESSRRAPGPGECLSFGAFELELETGVLRRQGERVSLQPQPALVLQILAEHAGAVVSRAELQAALWGAADDVDAEQGLNYCILQVRRALDDDAESPRFVETIPRRGYRFLQAVERRVEPLPGVSSQPPERSRRSLLLGGGLVLALLAAAIWVAAVGGGAKIRPRPRLVVLALDGDEGTGPAAAALTDEILSQVVARYGDRLTVTTADEWEDGEGSAPSGASYFQIGGTVLPAESGLQSVVWLERLPDRHRLWSGTYGLTDEPAARARCALRVVEEVATRLGLAPDPTTE
ncbi:MAG: winged helix-turn-helix domain-containing protein [Thermoanaerobaculia bacterium]